MSGKKDGGPAFPRPPVKIQRDALLSPEYVSGQTGMTLRDYFAGQALAGLATEITHDVDDHRVAGLAFRMADAMIKARELP